jgi:hypothetical protein
MAHRSTAMLHCTIPSSNKNKETLGTCSVRNRRRKPMATMTYRPGAFVKSANAAATEPTKGFWRRLVLAVQASRRRQAEIEIRRVRALMADTDPGFKHAMLPFRGE